MSWLIQRTGIFSLLALLTLSACQTSPSKPVRVDDVPRVVDTSYKATYPRPQQSRPSSKPPKKFDYTSLTDDTTDIFGQKQTLQLLYQQYSKWSGTPYRLGGSNQSGIDCSGFVQVTFRDKFGIDLPRTAIQQVDQGRDVRKADLQPGDLIFFRKGGHVGIYLEDDKFLHASTKVGVTISSLDNVYWSRNFWRAVSFRDSE